jgi:hypothetical protein
LFLENFGKRGQETENELRNSKKIGRIEWPIEIKQRLSLVNILKIKNFLESFIFEFKSLQNDGDFTFF